ncbi:glycosyltransferase family A protein [uncultured Psychrobacter sp.]|uniref:glycosyltransferase family A protein n=1 Tax=uncultured Psychrobacter sp. TaxID=259303 RepID=UPI00345AAC66
MIFVIPLRSEKTSSDWNNVCNRLEATINSILKQKDYYNDIDVIICGHERPDFLAKNSRKNIVFLKAPFNPPKDESEYMADKLNKKRFAGTYVKQELFYNHTSRIVMQLDADDIIHPSFASNIFLLFNENDTIDDIMIMNGYAFDYTRKELAYLDGTNKVFYRNCGSSFISKLSIEDLGSDITSKCYFNELTNHVKYPEVSITYNRNVKGCYFPGVMYLVNHGSNDASERHGVQKIQGFIDQFRAEIYEHPMAISLIKSI